SNSLSDKGRAAILKVFEFRLKAAGAAYRSQLNVENIEELFSLASALEGEGASEYISTAIAATLDAARRSTPEIRCKTITYQQHPQSDTLNLVESLPAPVSLYHLYGQILTGKLCDSTDRTRNTIITFNYDTSPQSHLLTAYLTKVCSMSARDVLKMGVA